MANKAYYLLQYLLLVRQVAAVAVSSQINLFAGVTDQASLEFSNTILLQQQFTLDNVVGVTIKGNSFSLEGSGNSRCIDIQDSSAVFSDLTITEGNATGGTSTTATNDRNGGGVRILGQSVVAFETCVIIDNVADKINEGNGGGVFISGLPSTARVSFTDCTISSNKASVRGGGIYVEAANVTIASSIFTLNIATLKYSSDDPGSGGAIAVKDQVGLHLSSTTFSFNEALGELTGGGGGGGGSPRLGGGAIFFTSKSSISVEYGWVVIANCLFKSNVARGNGGAISSSSIDFEIYSSSFVDNVAGSSGSGTGGAVYLDSGKIRGYAMESFSGNTEVGGVPNDVAGTNADEFECTSGCSAGFFGRGGSTAEGTSECFYGLKCVGCPGGKFLPTTDSILASDCQNCVQGRASEPGSAECSSCAVGTYATNQSDDTTGGQVAPVFEGAKFCLSCPAGTAGPSVSAVVCQSCAGNLWSSAGSSACARCKADYFYSLDDTCEACPAGTTCPSAGNSTQQHLSLSAGYWRSAVTTFPLSIKACPLTGSCLGGTDFDKGYCAKGFEGPLCAVCSARWYKFSNACYACDASWSGEFVAFLAITLLLVGIMFVFLLRRRRKQAGWSLSFATIRHLKNLGKTAFVNLQIITFMPTVLGVSFPSPFSDLLAILDFFKLDIGYVASGTECYSPGASSFYAYSLFVTLAPIIIVGCLFLCSKVLPETRDICFEWGVFLAYAMLPISSVAPCRLFSCEKFDGLGSFLRADYALSCDSPTYTGWLVFGAIMAVVWILGVPCLAASLLYKHRQDLLEPSEKRELNPHLKGFHLLFDGYQSQYFWWELWASARRLLLIGVLIILTQGSVLQFLIAIFVCVIGITMQSTFSPFDRLDENLLAMIAEWMVFFVVQMATVTKMRSDAFTGSKGTQIGIALTVFTTIVLLASFAMVYREVSESIIILNLNTKEVKFEWAATFSDDKFVTTLGSVIHNHVSRSNVLLYYYTSDATAKKILQSNGIPLLKDRGVVFSTRGPHDMKKGDSELVDLPDPGAISREVVLVCALPAWLLSPTGPATNKGRTSSSLWEVPLSLVAAFGKRPTLHPDIKQGHENSGAPTEFPAETLLLPLLCVERAFQLEEEPTAPAIDPTLLAQNINAPSVPVSGSVPKPKTKHDDKHSQPKSKHENKNLHIEITKVSTCQSYLTTMSKIRDECKTNGTVILYHYTSIANAELIAAGGLRMSTQGQGDGGVYFSTLGPASYSLGSDKYEDNIIGDCFGAARLDEYRGQGKLDVCLVYAAEAGVLQQAHGGRENAKVVSKATFLALSCPRDGFYYMPPTGLKAALLVDPSVGPPPGFDKESIEAEAARDQAVKDNLLAHERAVASVTKQLHRIMDSRQEGIFATAQMITSPKAQMNITAPKGISFETLKSFSSRTSSQGGHVDHDVEIDKVERGVSLAGRGREEPSLDRDHMASADVDPEPPTENSLSSLFDFDSPASPLYSNSNSNADASAT